MSLPTLSPASRSPEPTPSTLQPGARPGALAAAALLFDAQIALERIQPGSPAVAELGIRRLLAEARCPRSHDVAAVHRAGVSQ